MLGFLSKKERRFVRQHLMAHEEKITDLANYFANRLNAKETDLLSAFIDGVMQKYKEKTENGIRKILSLLNCTEDQKERIASACDNNYKKLASVMLKRSLWMHSLKEKEEMAKKSELEFVFKPQANNSKCPRCSTPCVSAFVDLPNPGSMGSKTVSRKQYLCEKCGVVE
jgi:hypothetical protein